MHVLSVQCVHASHCLLVRRDWAAGESGAGKTEAMKIALTYIGEISTQSASKDKKDAQADPVAARLMQTNPVMEAIGNAKTVRNNNSSRFGKHFDIQFDDKGAILGAFTSIYLLEKPRITEHMRGARRMWHDIAVCVPRHGLYVCRGCTCSGAVDLRSAATLLALCVAVILAWMQSRDALASSPLDDEV